MLAPSQKKRNTNNALQRLDLILRIDVEGGDDLQGLKYQLEALSDDTSSTDEFDVGSTEMSLSQMVYETLSEHKSLKVTTKKGKAASLPKFTRNSQPPLQSDKNSETTKSNSLFNRKSKLDKRASSISNRSNNRRGNGSLQRFSPPRDDTKKALLQNMIDSMEAKALSASVHSDFGSFGDRFAESVSIADISSHSTGALRNKKKRSSSLYQKKNHPMNVKLIFDDGNESC